jgi:ribonuclease D
MDTRRRRAVTIRVHEGDLPDLDRYGAVVAIDTETMGLKPLRDRLCVVQLSPGDGTVDVVRIARGQRQAPRVQALLADPRVLKLFHFARFDLAALAYAFGTMASPVWCTKIASRLVRTYTDRHGLKDLTRELLGVDLNKQQQSSDWGGDKLSEAQLLYAASDVLHLHAIRDVLQARLEREGRIEMAQACFNFLPARAWLDLAGWDDTDIFAHS